MTEKEAPETPATHVNANGPETIYQAFVHHGAAGQQAVFLPRNENLYEKILKSNGAEAAEAAHEEWQQNAIANMQTLNNAMRRLSVAYQNTGNLQWQNDPQTGQAYLVGRSDITNALEKALAQVMEWQGEEVFREPLQNSQHRLGISGEIVGEHESLNKLVSRDKELFDAVKAETGRSVGFRLSQ